MATSIAKCQLGHRQVIIISRLHPEILVATTQGSSIWALKSIFVVVTFSSSTINKHLHIPRIFTGGPGSGKDTLCAKLCAQFGFAHLSVGELLDKEVASGSSHGYMKVEPEFVLFLECSKEVMIARALSRNQGRSDDNEETMAKRLKVFSECTTPVLDHYSSKGKLCKINAEKSKKRCLRVKDLLFSISALPLLLQISL
ncbi:hypothetical protein Leryth_015883 [Lithospermum erythrorhizon]|nr:hypothetical protein Leryth_015883 [Lithospermum erythrorhizon]